MKFDAITWKTVWEIAAPLWFIGAVYVAAIITWYVYVHFYNPDGETTDDTKGPLEETTGS